MTTSSPDLVDPRSAYPKPPFRAQEVISMPGHEQELTPKQTTENSPTKELTNFQAGLP